MWRRRRASPPGEEEEEEEEEEDRAGQKSTAVGSGGGDGADGGAVDGGTGGDGGGGGEWHEIGEVAEIAEENWARTASIHAWVSSFLARERVNLHRHGCVLDAAEAAALSHEGMYHGVSKYEGARGVCTGCSIMNQQSRRLPAFVSRCDGFRTRLTPSV